MRFSSDVFFILMSFLYCTCVFSLFRWSSMRRSCVRRSATPSRTFTASGTLVLHFRPRLRLLFRVLLVCLGSELIRRISHLIRNQSDSRTVYRETRGGLMIRYESVGEMTVCLSSRFCPSVKAPPDRTDDPWSSFVTCRFTRSKNPSSIHLAHQS